MAVLTNFSDLKSYLGLDQAALSDYPSLELIMNSVDAAIVNFLGREIDSASRTETWYAIATTRMVPLTGLPISSVSSVIVTPDGVDPVTLTDTEYAASSYGLRLSAAVERSEIVVAYTGGPVAVPNDWARAAQIQARHEWQTRDQVASTQVFNDGGGATRPGAVLIEEVIRLLTPDVHPFR